jgi:hypothetical protein
VERLADVRRERRLAGGLALEPDEPAPVRERLDELDRAEPLTDAKTARGADERLPQAAVDLLDEEHLDGAAARAAKPQPPGDDSRVVEDSELAREEIGQVAEDTVLDLAGCAPVDEQPRAVPGLHRTLRDELRRKLVVEERGVHRAL